MDNVIVNGVAWKLNQSDMTLSVEHSSNLKLKHNIYLTVFLFKRNIINKTIIFLRIHRMSKTCLQFIHDRNITRDIQGTTYTRLLQ